MKITLKPPVLSPWKVLLTIGILFLMIIGSKLHAGERCPTKMTFQTKNEKKYVFQNILFLNNR